MFQLKEGVWGSVLWAASLGSLALGSAAGFQGAPGRDKAAAAYEKQVLPILAKSCLPCHSGDEPAGNVDLAKINSGKGALASLELLERSYRNIKNRTMPPSRSKPLSDADRTRLVDSIHALLRTECDLDDPGRVTIRRLSRYEYANTVRDLLGVDMDVTSDFPSDDVGHGFDSIGDVLTLSPLHLNQYLTAAEKLASAAIPSSQPRSRSVDLGTMALKDGVAFDEGLGFYSQGVATAKVEFKEGGNYALKILAGQTKGGPEDAKMAVFLDGRQVDSFPVAALRGKPLVYELPLEIKGSGARQLSIAFINDFYQAGVADRNLYVLGIEIVGPSGASSVGTPIQRELLPSAIPAGGIREAARISLKRFASRAYRRPVTEPELTRILSLFDEGLKLGGREDGIRLAVEGILTSPNFLFRAELDGSVASGKPRELNDYELASRLSYFLWASMPDESLSAIAQNGSLRSEQGLLQAVDRMVKDPKAGSLADSFAMQWLELERLATRLPDPKVFPDWNEGLRKDMVTETKLFFMDVVSNDRSILDFLDGPYTYVNRSLASHYGLKGSFDDRFVRVNLEGTPRGGLLTQGSILTVTSNPNRTSPVKRGKWVLDQILGSPPPPPPPGVGEIKAEIRDQPVTLRAKMEQHRENPACAVCHEKMDPLGFGLENFDGVGAWREKDSGQTIDASGQLPGGITFNGPTELRKILKARSDDFAEVFAGRLLTYALGRGLRPADRCYVEDIAATAKKSGYTFSSFVKAIVLSDPFRKRANKRPQ